MFILHTKWETKPIDEKKAKITITEYAQLLAHAHQDHYGQWMEKQKIEKDYRVKTLNADYELHCN